MKRKNLLSVQLNFRRLNVHKNSLYQQPHPASQTFL